MGRGEARCCRRHGKPLRSISFQGTGVARYRLCAIGLLLLLSLPGFAGASDDKMRGPHSRPCAVESVQHSETDSIELALLSAVGFYRKFISPVGGDRCGFRPSCSAFGKQAIIDQGPMAGIMMTADRLMRCHPFIKAGPDYTQLPDGKLYDPPAKNLLSQP
jgi:uncharacterized protein